MRKPFLILFFILAKTSLFCHDLDSLAKLVNQTIYVDKAKGMAQLNFLSQEAKNQNNTYYQSFVKAKWVEIYYSQFDTDSIFLAAAEAESFAWKHKKYNFFFVVQQIVIQRFADQNMYAHGLEKAKQMYQFAKEIESPRDMARAATSIAHIYNRMDMSTESIRYLNESLSLLATANPSVSVNRLRLENYREIAMNYQNLKELHQLKIYADSMQIVISEMLDQNAPPASLDDSRSHAEYYYTLFYIDSGNLELAEKHFEAFRMLLPDFPGFHEQLLDHLYYTYYLKKGLYKEALEYNEKLIKFYTENNLETTLISALEKRGELFALMDDYKSASESYAESIRLAEKHNKQKFYSNLNELRTIYELDKITVEKERNRIYFITALVGCILLLILLTVWIFYSRKISSKNRSLMNQIREQDRLLEELERKENRLRGLSLEKKQDHSLEKDSQEDELYTRLKTFMKDKTIFTDPDINRRSIAEILHTNEKYLADCIRRNENLTFTEFINTYRLHYARQLLSAHQEEYTIETIAIDSGFGSRKTFHRLFKECYGLSPNEFRRLLENE